MTGKSCIPETLALPPAGIAETDARDKVGNARGFHQGTRAGDGTSPRCRIYGRNSSVCRSAHSLLQRGADHIWVRVKHLASRVLSLAARRVAADFPARYGERVVLLETFVERPRHRGTCYRAANWQYLGETTGRGKGDRTHRAALPRKAVYVYPLAADFRAALGVAA